MSLESDGRDAECGLGAFRPRWLQKLNSAKTFFAVHSLASILEGAMITHLIGSLTTLEKRFGFDTSFSGIVLFGEDIAPIFMAMLIGYFGGKSHRPRVISLGLIMISLSSFVISLPYFIYGARYYKDTAESFNTEKPAFHSNLSSISELCSEGAKNHCENTATKFAFYLLVLGQFIKGFGSPTLYTVGTSYIDDGLKKKHVPAFLGPLIAFRMLGPAFGSLISSFCLHLYEDPFYDPGFDQKDPRWIGAWWLGFVIIGFLVLLFAFPMFLFPRHPKRIHASPTINTTTQVTTSPESESAAIHRMKGFFQTLYRVGKNPILLCYYVGTVFRVNGMMGYFILLPKYMEMQFQQSASEANRYAGPISLVGMQVGSILGGIVISKFKPGPRALTGGVMVVESFSFIALIICMLITCPPYKLSGTTSTDNGLNLWNECNANCECTTSEFTPVCGPDGVSTYFSACFAGCSGLNASQDGQKVYTDCQCVHGDDGMLTTGSTIANYCGSDCQWMIIYIVVLTLGKLTAATAIVGNVLITLRCVDKRDKSIALGTVSSVVALLALIPHPLLYGAMTDHSCLVWEESCGVKGNCWIYDVDKLRYLLHGVSAAFVFVGFLCDVLVWALSSRIGNLYVEDDEIDDHHANYEKDEKEKSINMLILKNETFRQDK